MTLNKQNYFGPDAAVQYMSVSQLKSFLNCEAAALAEIRGEYKREKTTALMVGGFIDAHFSMEEHEFADNNPEMFKKDGTLKAEYIQAVDIIDRILADRLMTTMLRGEVQKIVTGEIEGVPFRGKLDSLISPAQCLTIADEFPEMEPLLTVTELDDQGELVRKGTGAIVDLKVMRDLLPIYMPGAGRVSFIQAWRYDLQLGCYQRLIGGKLPCFIAAATKERVPDIALIHIPQYQLDVAFDQVADLIPRYQAIKAGEIEPSWCKKCDYCKTKKTITGAVSADELEGEA
jgi:hypothetical protein